MIPLYAPLPSGKWAAERITPDGTVEYAYAVGADRPYRFNSEVEALRYAHTGILPEDREARLLGGLEWRAKPKRSITY